MNFTEQLEGEVKSIAIVISSEAKNYRKTRSTIQSYIKTGKLSKIADRHTGVVGIDTSDLIRCFG